MKFDVVVISPMFLCISETWTLTNENKTEQQAMGMRFLRNFAGTSFWKEEDTVISGINSSSKRLAFLHKKMNRDVVNNFIGCVRLSIAVPVFIIGR